MYISNAHNIIGDKATPVFQTGREGPYKEP